MPDSKKGETKNQHYVPQFYQRNFSVDGKTIGAYILEREKVVEQAPIKHQSSEDYFYSENMKIEGALSGMEALASDVITKILANPKVILSKEERYTIYSFVIIQIGKTLAQANLIQETADKTARMMLKKYVAAMRNSEDAAEVEGLTDEIIDSVSINLKEPGLFALGTQAQLVNTCIDLECKVLMNNTKIPFVTSDNPACMYDSFLERMDEFTYALGSRGLQIYFPLSDRTALFYYDSKCYKLGDRKKNYVEITDENDIKELNKLSACSANKVIYYKAGTISKPEIVSLGELAMRFKPEAQVETIEGGKTDNGEIVGTLRRSMFCHLKLNFVKELPVFKAKTKESYNPRTDRLREIAYYKDEIVKRSRKDASK